MDFLGIGIVILIPICAVKFILTTLEFIIIVQCILIGDTIEKCTNGSLFGENHQKVYDQVSAYASLFEAMSAVFCVVAVMCWKPFQKKNFFISIFFVGHFYSWGALLAFFIVSNVSLQIVHAGSEPWILAFSNIAEAVFTIILAGAVNFIDREYLRRKLQNNVAFYLYNVILLLCAYRNLTLFLYDTGLVALSVSLLSEERTSSSKDVTSFVLVMNVALRGSMAQFYFAKLFQGRRLKKVCNDDGYNHIATVNQTAGNDKHRRRNRAHPRSESNDVVTGNSPTPDDIEYASVCELG